MKAVARVRNVREGRAILACASRADACSGCGGGRGCALRWLTSAEGRLEVPVRPTAGLTLAPGDGVVVEVAEGEVLRAAALAYLPPLTGLLAGALLARVLLPEVEPAAPLLAVVGLVAGWGMSRAWLRRRPPRYTLTAGEAS
jgi:positive regulator of sigma E activity